MGYLAKEKPSYVLAHSRIASSSLETYPKDPFSFFGPLEKAEGTVKCRMLRVAGKWGVPSSLIQERYVSIPENDVKTEITPRGL